MGQETMIESFDQITDYCERNNKSISIRNHAVCIYLSVLKEANNIPQNQTPARIEASKATLLTEQSIAGYVSRAESILDEYNQALIGPYKDRPNSSFASNVLSSVIGSFVFSLIIVAAFYLGKEQVQSWLQSLN
jgi:predicted PurR-regulated permease PerM